MAVVADTTKTETTRLKPSEFAIFPWGGTDGDLSVFKDEWDCGFNLAGFVKPEDLDKVSQAGLQGFVYDRAILSVRKEYGLDQQKIEQWVNALVSRAEKQHNAVFGYYLWDEPSASSFPVINKWVDAFRKADPDGLAYVNLLPTYANSKQLGTASYEEYLESFIQTVHPSFMSYDHYALIDDGTIRSGYFQNLEAMRKAALKHNMPFWNVVLANAHFNYAEPTPAGFRFQAYTTMAYGGRGIGYFTYFRCGASNCRLSPIDHFGNKTPTWDMLRNVNVQIHRLGPVYITLKSINVFHHPEVPSECSGIDTSKLLTSVSGGNLLIGEFEGPGGQPFVMVVNKDLHKSTTYAVKFKQDGQVQKVYAYTGSISNLGGEDNWLAPGQGMLLCLKKN